MADEAAVENLPVNRFFCHKCSQEVPGVLPVSPNIYSINFQTLSSKSSFHFYFKQLGQAAC